MRHRVKLYLANTQFGGNLFSSSTIQSRHAPTGSKWG
jgi:hypothetical protein